MPRKKAMMLTVYRKDVKPKDVAKVIELLDFLGVDEHISEFDKYWVKVTKRRGGWDVRYGLKENFTSPGGIKEDPEVI